MEGRMVMFAINTTQHRGNVLEHSVRGFNAFVEESVAEWLPNRLRFPAFWCVTLRDRLFQ